MGNRKFNNHLSDLKNQTNNRQWRQSTIDNLEKEGDKIYDKSQRNFDKEQNKFNNISNQFDDKIDVFNNSFNSMLGLNHNEKKQADALLKQIYDKITLEKISAKPRHHSMPRSYAVKLEPFDPKIKEFDEAVKKILNEEKQTKTIPTPKVPETSTAKVNTAPQSNNLQKAQDTLLNMTKIAHGDQKDNPKWNILRTVMQKNAATPEKVANYIVKSLEKQGKEVTPQNIVDHFQKLNKAKEANPERMTNALLGKKSENMSRSTSASSLNTSSLSEESNGFSISFSTNKAPSPTKVLTNDDKSTKQQFQR